MSDRLTPADAERYLIALLQPVTTTVLRDDALAKVTPDDFATGKYAAIWEAARDLRHADRTINRRNLLAALEARGASGPALDLADRLLTELTGYVPATTDYPQALSEVTRCGRLRRVVETCERIKQHTETAEDAGQALTIAHELLAKLDETVTDQGDVRMFADLLEEFIDSQEAPEDELLIPTPWTDINDALNGGVRGGRMYVIGARPGDGKSLAAHQIAQHAAHLGHSALVFSAEMGAAEVTGRMVASGALIEQSDITRRSLRQSDWHRFQEYADRARNYKLGVVDKSNLTMPYIKQVCRNHQRRHGLAVVVLDYLQLIGGDARGAVREQEVSAISRQAKQLSRELECAFIVAAQLNRENVRHGRRPIMADLRESGGIEADADVVLLHSRPLIEDGPRKGEPGPVLLVDIVKNRHGRTGPVELDWRPNYATIGSAVQQDNVVPIYRRGEAS